MVSINILRDNREQKPWEFENFDATTEDVTINTGDYTLAELCRHDEEKDTYYPNYAIERKAGRDFFKSITRNSDRFKAEINRTSDWDTKLRVLVEEPKRTFKRQQKFMRYNEMSWKQISGIIGRWEREYNVSFEFVGTRERAQRIAFDALFSQLRAVLNSPD